jgi:hypothetical protein
MILLRLAAYELPVTSVYPAAFANIIQQNPNMVDEDYDSGISCNTSGGLMTLSSKELDS